MDNEEQENDNNFNEMRIPLRMPNQIDSSPHIMLKCMFHSAFTMIFLTMMTLFIIIGMISHTGHKVSTTLSDSQLVITDLKTIMPEIKQGLEILHDFCHIPEFKEYCFPHLYINNTYT